MEHLTLDDTQKLLKAIEQLYSLHDLSSFPVACLEIVDRLVPGDMPGFHQSQLQTQQIEYTVLPGHPGLSPELQAVPSEYWHENPITQHMPDTLYGAYKLSDFTSPDELHRIEGVYQQFMRVMGWEDMMTIFLPPAPPENWSEILTGDLVTAGMTFTRTQRDYSERDRLILNLLHPHLSQAWQNACRYHSVQQNLNKANQDLDCLGAIVLDRLGRIQSIGTSAVKLLQTYFPESNSNLYLPDLVWSWVRHQADIATDDARLDRARLPLRIERDGRQLTIRSFRSPAEDRYLLLLEERTLSLFPLLEMLGLSPRETEVLYFLMRGESNQAIANRLDLNLGTVRKHLEHIFHKLGVQSRTEAIARVLFKLGLF